MYVPNLSLLLPPLQPSVLGGEEVGIPVEDSGEESCIMRNV